MLYYYGMRLRPVSPGAQPKGMVSWWEGTGRYWGIIAYNRELTPQELEDYELDKLPASCNPDQFYV